MKGDFVVCPACGTRNKPKWEFCARCGESLQGLPIGEPAPVEAVLDDAEDTAAPGAVPWITGLGVFAFGALAVAMWGWSQKQAAAARPDPSVFTLPTMPASAPPPRPGVIEPGRDAFDEGRRLLMKGDTAGAIPLLAQAVADAPQNGTYRSVYAKALLASGSTDDALRQFEAALRLSPESVGVLSDAARALDRAGQPAEAARLYDAVLTQQPDNEQALRDLSGLHELGHVLEKTGDVKGAAEAYERVLAERPDAHVTRGLLAEIHFTQGEKDQAIAIMRDGVTSDAQAPLPHRGLGSLLERTGQYAEAAKEYREYARLAPGAADAKQLEDRADRIERRLAAANPTPPGT